jgi:hypothetical protein
MNFMWAIGKAESEDGHNFRVDGDVGGDEAIDGEFFAGGF